MSGLRKTLLCSMALLVAMVTGCDRPVTKETENSRQLESFSRRTTTSKPIAKSESKSGMFVLAESTGIKFANRLNPENEIPYLTNGAGVAIGDIDNNGLPDIFFSGQDVSNRLFRQTAPFKFEDITDIAGVSGADRIASGATFVDINSDGLLDLYVCNYLAANELYINEGNGRFTESAKEYNLDIEQPTTMAAFMDYDRDGDLDVYLVNNRRYRQEMEQNRYKIYGRNGEIKTHPSMYFEFEGRHLRNGHEDYLMRNVGGKFLKVNSTSGIQGYGMGLSATWWDYNNDGWPDLWVCNDLKSPDHLYVNQQDGTFKDLLPDIVSYTTWNSMGSDFADFNNDGFFDFFAADMSATSHYKSKKNMGDMNTNAWFLKASEPRQFMRNCLYLNNESGRLKESAYLSGVARTDWTWSVKCADLDCDGFNDIFATNGMVDNTMDADFVIEFQKLLDAKKLDEAEKFKPPRLIEENVALRNTDGIKFENVSKAWGLNLESITHGAALSDLDGDGDLDIVINNYDQPASIYRNEVSSGNRLLVSLHGKGENTYGVGARITLHTSIGTLDRMLSPTRGYMSSDEPIIHFGLGDNSEIEKLVVRWPSGTIQEVTGISPNQHLQIVEAAPKDISADANMDESNQETIQWFAESNAIDFAHTENDFDDFAYQLLLPNQLSTQGPGMAWADVNGDGTQDCFVGGAAEQAGQLFLSEGGQLKKAEGPWNENAGAEDMAAVWIDVDADKDLDLYVASGSNEFDANDQRFRDRIYLNDGAANFEDVTEAWLPDIRECSSTVSAADFDQDGKMDLFVGSRMKTREYPLRSKSRLLRNTGNEFVDVTKEMAPTINHLRLVTSSAWADINNDSWIDLVVTSEWGTISIYENESGKLVNKTSQYGLDDLLGWWNGITIGDFDSDGRVDIVATNFGLNTKYGNPSAKKPLHLYYGDFDENGKIDLIEAKTDKKQGLLPVRGKSCSCHQIPSLHEKFPTYHEFAIAGLDELYELEEGDELTCNFLKHVLLKNNGDGSFKIMELPQVTQLAPSFGSVASDFNGDGVLDLYMLQNFYGPQIETGRMSGGLSVMLQGNGDGTFQPVSESDSNLVVPGDARAVAVSDLNNDNRPDLVITQNNAAVRSFNHAADEANYLKIVLRGTAGNMLGIGAVVKVTCDGEMHNFQIASNTGYLASASNQIFVGLADYSGAITIDIQWADGKTSQIGTDSSAGTVIVAHPNESSEVAIQRDDSK